MPPRPLLEADLTEIQDKLNKFEPADVAKALDEQPLLESGDARSLASGSLTFGTSPLGVLVYRAQTGMIRVRVVMTEMTGGSYQEFELTDAAMANLASALLARLENEHRPRRP
jgi:hypothetical protein